MRFFFFLKRGCNGLFSPQHHKIKHILSMYCRCYIFVRPPNTPKHEILSGTSSQHTLFPCGKMVGSARKCAEWTKFRQRRLGARHWRIPWKLRRHLGNIWVVSTERTRPRGYVEHICRPYLRRTRRLLAMAAGGWRPQQGGRRQPGGTTSQLIPEVAWSALLARP